MKRKLIPMTTHKRQRMGRIEEEDNEEQPAPSYCNVTLSKKLFDD